MRKSLYKNQLNAAHICAITITVNELCSAYEYRHRISLFGLTVRKAGFYRCTDLGFLSSPFTVSQLESDGRKRCFEAEVFWKPYITIRMADQRTHDMYFDTTQELYAYLKTAPFSTINWIHGETVEF